MESGYYKLTCRDRGRDWCWISYILVKGSEEEKILVTDLFYFNKKTGIWDSCEGGPDQIQSLKFYQDGYYIESLDPDWVKLLGIK
jgi:hypothetical protein